jgi:hypothetical protein
MCSSPLPVWWCEGEREAGEGNPGLVHAMVSVGDSVRVPRVGIRCQQLSAPQALCGTRTPCLPCDPQPHSIYRTVRAHMRALTYTYI